MTVKTKRLTIRSLRPDDSAAFRNIASDFAASDYAVYDCPIPLDKDELAVSVKAFSETGLYFAVCKNDGGREEMIGYICFHVLDGEYDIGYCFASDHHGQGYALESCRAVLEYAEKELGAAVFTAGTALKNEPSCRLLAKLGFELKYIEQLSFNTDAFGNDIVFDGGVFVRNVTPRKDG